jgi:hypothetical protein
LLTVYVSKTIEFHVLSRRSIMDQLPSRADARAGESGDFTLVSQENLFPAEETLVTDVRAGVRPSQMVERKLAVLLKGRPAPLIHAMTARRTSSNR